MGTSGRCCLVGQGGEKNCPKKEQNPEKREPVQGDMAAHPQQGELGRNDGIASPEDPLNEEVGTAEAGSFRQNGVEEKEKGA